MPYSNTCSVVQFMYNLLTRDDPYLLVLHHCVQWLSTGRTFPCDLIVSVHSDCQSTEDWTGWSYGDPSPCLCSQLSIKSVCDSVGMKARIPSMMGDAYWLAHNSQILEKERCFLDFLIRLSQEKYLQLCCHVTVPEKPLSLSLFPFLSFHFPFLFFSLSFFSFLLFVFPFPFQGL